MKIVHTPPPNYEAIRKAFPAADFDAGTIFTYGDEVFTKKPLPDHLEAHEAVHTRQQTDPAAWWDRYLVDTAFRFDQELEAYRAQWQFVLKHYRNREERAYILHAISRDLAGPMYGNIISQSDARRLIEDL